ncbi:hypothetical protein D3X56_05480 [Acinetobacter baumannii]|uniref:hypothetical protein n=1 Tax=Acinetobacter baumannii TaxID=470 RepID=UPI000E68180A|nr:hypothetical protein [Acinetobacter baumannii]RIW63756.1 hypothetical protein D3X24_07820 [Acinetobacter baumannii]RIX05921.1 hypothetical protein D3X41_08150 [Acinetobacter baumannii]RIX20796.1 hypothetical protein D3X39_12450 [Acinetobacter baumannii]RIX21059.1 hypothetical protein D3X69_01710 [Acinetobacter baumannii]RIX33632.1 hypothetical protein D3X60_07625 [Acinetobacter baumannii]
MKTLNRTKKLNFDDQLSLLVFGCHASAPFSVKDVKELVFDFNRGTIYSNLQKFVEWKYFERVGKNHYKATQFAKDLLNVKGELKA